MASSPPNKQDDPARPAPGAGKPQPALSSKIDRIEAEMRSVDFTSIFSPAAKPVMPPAARPARAAPPVAAKVVAPAPPVKVAPRAGSVAPVQPRPASARPAPAEPAPARPVPAASDLAKSVVRSQGISSVMMMEFAASPFDAAPVLEQAAILFANGQFPAARDALKTELKLGKMPPAAAREGWMLLFDLFENLGHHAEFDSAAIDFAVAFETSPPAYNNRSDVKDSMLETGGGQYFALTGVLGGAAATQFAQLAKIAARGKMLRIEFGKIEAVAEAGCKLLFEHLRAYKKSGYDLMFASAGHLIELLNGAIETGRRTDPEVFWLLLMEMYQFQSMQAAFEEAALNYCITYEVSPPSWVEPARSPVQSPPPVPVNAQLPKDALYVKGVLQGSTGALFKAINSYAAGKTLVVIDLFDLRRIDVASAGAFINLVTALQGQGKEIEIRSPSPLVATLFVSMGLAEQVRFTQRGA